MDMVRNILKEELNYALELKEHYLDNLKKMPRGSLSVKKINGREYTYIQYRDGRKIISRIIPGEELPDLKDKIKKRGRYRKLLKEVDEKISYLRKALNVKP